MLTEVSSEHKTVEVYFEAAVIRGTLLTRHDRLSDQLGIPEETFVLQRPAVRDLKGQAIPSSAQNMIVYKQRVIFVVDLSAVKPLVSGQELLRVDRDHQSVLIGAGPFWIRGDIHLPKGADLQSFAVRKDRFIPVTEATLLEHGDRQAQTLLLNRDQINSLVF